ncbi:hypothetical protein B5C34_01555 [Pacificimonas flava]|uniref:Uncharacterized protein n=2 Tax=Pacificimonas TaxID=1960290 RepID=A0A219B236_9SPHN|nr:MULTISPECIES: glycosyltransferase family 39 protein [Pacificimonas]MBZ6378097.1 glycosyltransferase family 39 protein [Pacificimonas aurantium]OWV32264.1 hypothetical protein B5C34_01555 [Pacificimonas flava]
MPSALPRIGSGTLACLVVAAAALVIRLPALGDPNYHMDEQFYLLFGEMMTQGALPYVDVWDRKPVGLFLLYAVFALFGDGLLAYQLGALLAAGGTAMLICAAAMRRTGPAVAAAAGIVYLLALEFFMGGGGQSPIFYNLPVMLAFLLLLRSCEREGETDIFPGAAAMLLCGLAVAVKPTALFEGAGIGLGFLWLWHRRGVGFRPLLQRVFWFALCGGGPSLAGAALMYALGAGPAYIQAAFISVFERTAEGSLGWPQARKMLILLSPLMAPTLLFCALGKARAPLAFYVVGAFAGFFVVPNFFVHYALPLLPPFILAAVWMFRSDRLRGVYLAVLALMLAVPGQRLSAEPHLRSKETTAALARTVGAHLDGGCLYVYDGPVSLYRETGACKVTPYLFPEHLNFARERFALPQPADEAMRGALAARPAVIVTRPRPIVPAPNRQNFALLSEELERSYEPVATLPETTVEGERDVIIWALKR